MTTSRALFQEAQHWKLSSSNRLQDPVQAQPAIDSVEGVPLRNLAARWAQESDLEDCDDTDIPMAEYISLVTHYSLNLLMSVYFR